MKELPEGFREMLHRLMDNEAEDLIKALDEEPVTSIRINKRKPVTEFSNMEYVKWCESGYYLKKRPEFIFDPLLHAGAYYVQDASSMIYETVTDKLLNLLHQNENSHKYPLRILDLCASPGGKTTAMINALPDDAEVVANEYVAKRVGALKENLERWGFPNVTVTNRNSAFYGEQGEEFDIVAVDAPCSGEGMMRKEEMARTQWSENLVLQCAALQKEILHHATNALKPGGFLIYSTCTFNRTENEENAEFIVSNLNLEPVDLCFPKEWDIPGGYETLLPVYRFMPHKTKGEGLFLAVFRKQGDWEPSKKLSSKGKIMKKVFQKEEKREKFNEKKIEVDRSTAIAYLRGESIVLPPETPKGIVSISYKGLTLGDAKNIGSRANNLYPKNRRIRKQ